MDSQNQDKWYTDAADYWDKVEGWIFKYKILY